MFELVAFAETAEEAAAPVSGMSAMISQLVVLVGVIVLMYFMLIRPQRKREKEAKAMIAALKVGDKVVTIGGIMGKVTKVKDDYVILETGSVGNVNEKSYIRIARNSISEVEKKAEA